MQSNSVIIACGHLDSGTQLMAAFIFTWKVVAAAPDMSRTVGKDGKQKEEAEKSYMV